VKVGAMDETSIHRHKALYASLFAKADIWR